MWFVSALAPSTPVFASECHLHASFQNLVSRTLELFGPIAQKKFGLRLSVSLTCEPRLPIPLNANLDTLDDSGNLANLPVASQAEVVLRVAEDLLTHGTIATHLSEDGFAMLLCHELGHFMGGEPVYPDSEGTRLLYAWGKTIEGQADYFAAKSCLWTLWQNEPNAMADTVAAVPSAERGIADQICRARYDSPADQALCARIALAGLNLMQFFEKMDQPDPRFWPLEPSRVSLAARDTSEVEETEVIHPELQCRVDTYLAGALRRERPRCWYKP